MIKLIIIAGPQSSGKTTVFNLLRQKYPVHHYLEEINPYTLVGKDHPGAAFTNGELEIKLVNHELKILETLSSWLDPPAGEAGRTKMVIVETGIFHLVYLEKFAGKALANRHYQKYLKLHQFFKPQIIFIDTKPEVSWRRRKDNYLARIRKSGITNPTEIYKRLNKYQTNLYHLYPLWLKYYQKLPFEKIMIKNSKK